MRGMPNWTVFGILLSYNVIIKGTCFSLWIFFLVFRLKSFAYCRKNWTVFGILLSYNVIIKGTCFSLWIFFLVFRLKSFAYCRKKVFRHSEIMCGSVVKFPILDSSSGSLFSFELPFMHFIYRQKYILSLFSANDFEIITFAAHTVWLRFLAHLSRRLMGSL